MAKQKKSAKSQPPLRKKAVTKKTVKPKPKAKSLKWYRDKAWELTSKNDVDRVMSELARWAA